MASRQIRAFRHGEGVAAVGWNALVKSLCSGSSSYQVESAAVLSELLARERVSYHDSGEREVERPIFSRRSGCGQRLAWRRSSQDKAINADSRRSSALERANNTSSAALRAFSSIVRSLAQEEEDTGSGSSPPVVPPDVAAAAEARLQDALTRYLQQTAALQQPHLSAGKAAAVAKELSSLEADAQLMQQLQRNREDTQAALEMIRESAAADVASAACSAAGEGSAEVEAQQLLEEELRQLAEERAALLWQAVRQLVPRDSADGRGCILEVRAGAGGDEASLFAADVFAMWVAAALACAGPLRNGSHGLLPRYQRFSARMGWRFEVLDTAGSEHGGLKEGCAAIAGDRAFGMLKHESGVHRVQRVPATEKAGRVHTSTATVAVLPQAEEVDVCLRPEDLRIDTFRSSGAGGQSVNTTSSAVRVTHLPTGLAVVIQDERSQHQNKAKALKVLRARLFDRERRAAQQAQAQMRQGQVGSGDRSERIRTYNFPQGRVTDHRINLTVHGLPAVLAGEELQGILDALCAEEERRLMRQLLEEKQGAKV